MNNKTWEHGYLDLLQDCLDNGSDRQDRTSTGTRALFGKFLDIDLSKGFPAVTTKKLAFKAMVSELLWFLEGSNDERRLCEILHGTRDSSKKTIWTDNANADYWKPKADFEGDLGRVYGVQWRSWKRYSLKGAEDHISHPEGGRTYLGAKVLVQEIDQVQELIKKLKTNNTDRRMIINAFNVGEIQDMALPPCHQQSQFFVSDSKLSCMMTQRSADLALGIPLNIASYALLTHMLAQVSGLEVGRLIMSLGDAHIYSDHLEGVLEQLSRTPKKAPVLKINKAVTDIDGFCMDDFSLEGYEHYPSIKLKMAV
jgi:thymidylate synthase